MEDMKVENVHWHSPGVQSFGHSHVDWSLKTMMLQGSVSSNTMD